MEIKDLAELHSVKAGSNSLALENFSGEFFPHPFRISPSPFLKGMGLLRPGLTIT
jgi:hypothetical protein